MREVFRSGVQFVHSFDMNQFEKHLDKGLISEINSTVAGTTTRQVTVYSSDFSFFAGAAAVELFTIGIVLYTFYGWWRLGRNTSLSPLETAKVGIMKFWRLIGLMSNDEQTHRHSMRRF